MWSFTPKKEICGHYVNGLLNGYVCVGRNRSVQEKLGRQLSEMAQEMTLEVLVVAVVSDTGHQCRGNLPPIVPLIME